MSVPSYDDLTPGIPDVVDAETPASLASLLRELPASGCQRPASGFQLPASGFQLSASSLFACLRLAAGSAQQEAGSAQQEAGSGQQEAGSGQQEAGSGKLAAVLAVARDFSPRVMKASERDVLLDVSGLGRLIGPPEDIERQLAHALFDAKLEASVAIGPTQTVARLLAHAETGHGLTLRHNAHKDHKEHKTDCDLCGLRGLCAGACRRGAWLQLPVDLLRALEVLPPAMNDRDRARPYDTFERWGIATLGDLAALPAADLSSRLGRRGVALQRLARGLDPAPFVPDPETPRYVERLELEWPAEALEPLSFVFARLLDPLAIALERADRGAAAVRLDLRLTDRSTDSRVLQLPAPMRDPRVLRTLLLLDLESHPPAPLCGFGETGALTAAIDVVTIELDPAPARITQFSLLRRALPSPETLSTLTARLSALVGDARVGSPVLLDSHRPDAFDMTRYTPERGAPERGARGAEVPVGPTFPPSPRLRWTAVACEGGRSGVPRPTPVPQPAPVLRRVRTSLALRVAVEQGRPVHIASSRRGVPAGAIVEAAGPWRSSGEWWSDRSWSRNEWDVALKNGAVCRIYQDRTTDRWFFDGLYD